VAVAALTAANQEPLFSASRPLAAAPVVRAPVLREFTIQQADVEEQEEEEEAADAVPGHIWFLAVAVAILLTVLILLIVGFLYQRSAVLRRQRSKDAELGGRVTPGSSVSGGSRYYYCSGGSSSWMERYWGGGGGLAGAQPFQTFKSDHRLMAVDNHYDYVLQAPADSSAAMRGSAEASQYYAHYASAPIIKAKNVGKPSSNYTVLLPNISPGQPI
jgi:hypothetical protein